MASLPPAAIRFTVVPRDVPPQKAARRLHLTLEQFEQVRDSLFARGFPRPDPTTGMYDLVAIDGWMDARSKGLTPSPVARNAQEVFSERARRLVNG